MTISKKVLSLSILASITMIINAVSMKGFDTISLVTCIQRAEYELQFIHNELQNTARGPQQLLTGKAFAKKLYGAQKTVFKAIKKELKCCSELHKYNDSHSYRGAQQLYKAFKHWVYKSWKKRVKAQYKGSKKSDDPHAWGWIHHQKLIIEKS